MQFCIRPCVQGFRVAPFGLLAPMYCADKLLISLADC